MQIWVNYLLQNEKLFFYLKRQYCQPPLKKKQKKHRIGRRHQCFASYLTLTRVCCKWQVVVLLPGAIKCLRWLEHQCSHTQHYPTQV